MKGTWTGSGTWKTSGPDFTGLLQLGALVGVIAGVAMVVIEYAWVIGIIAAVILVGAVIGLVWWLRTAPARDAEAAKRYAAHFRAAEATERRSQVTRAAQPQAIEHHYHAPSIHIRGGDQDEAARLIRQALTREELP